MNSWLLIEPRFCMHWVLDMPGGLVMVRGVFDRVLESGAKDLPGKTMQRGKRRIKVLKFS